MALSGNHTDQSVFIYDSDGNHLIDTVVKFHDREEKHLQVGTMPESLKVNDDCKLLILSAPVPCEYLGKVKKVGGNLLIAMFQGHTKESREAARYNINTSALIDRLITEGKPYELHTPVKVVLLNISTSGVRFRAPFYSFDDGDMFEILLDIKDNKKRLIAQVVNHVDREPAVSDYGCRFIESAKNRS